MIAYHSIAPESEQSHSFPCQVLEGWQASRSIERERELQELVAALHCTYPRLLPARIQEMSEAEIVERVEKIKWMLQR